MLPHGILIVFKRFIDISQVCSSVKCSSTLGICKIYSQLGLFEGLTCSKVAITVERSLEYRAGMGGKDPFKTL